MQKILNDCQQRRVKLPEELREAMDVVLDAHELDPQIAGQMKYCPFFLKRVHVAPVASIDKFWQSPVIKVEIEQRENALQLPTSTPYFFTHAKRFAAPDYLPTDEDIVHARLRTTGSYFLPSVIDLITVVNH